MANVSRSEWSFPKVWSVLLVVVWWRNLNQSTNIFWETAPVTSDITSGKVWVRFKLRVMSGLDLISCYMMRESWKNLVLTVTEDM